MSEYAVMPLADYQDACEAVREKTNSTDRVTSDRMAALIRSITGGEDLTEVLGDQDVLIAQILTALEDKAAGGTSETWTFTMEDGTTVEKDVVVA